jgi:hypothetical protein
MNFSKMGDEIRAFLKAKACWQAEPVHLPEPSPFYSGSLLPNPMVLPADPSAAPAPREKEGAGERDELIASGERPIPVMALATAGTVGNRERPVPVTALATAGTVGDQAAAGGQKIGTTGACRIGITLIGVGRRAMHEHHTIHGVGVTWILSGIVRSGGTEAKDSCSGQGQCHDLHLQPPFFDRPNRPCDQVFCAEVLH